MTVVNFLSLDDAQQIILKNDETLTMFADIMGYSKVAIKECVLRPNWWFKYRSEVKNAIEQFNTIREMAKDDCKR